MDLIFIFLPSITELKYTTEQVGGADLVLISEAKSFLNFDLFSKLKSNLMANFQCLYLKLNLLFQMPFLRKYLSYQKTLVAASIEVSSVSCRRTYFSKYKP